MVSKGTGSLDGDTMSSSEVADVNIEYNENSERDASRAPKGRHAIKSKDIMESMEHLLIGVETSM